MKKILAISMCLFPIFCAAANDHGITVVKGLTSKYADLTASYFDKNYPKTLMNIEARERKFLLNANIQNDPYSTHIKRNIDLIPLAIEFKQVPNLNSNQIIGFAPLGAMKKGWTGVKEFFRDEHLGVCEYSKKQMISLMIDAGIFTHDVNQKMTVKEINGNDETGYLYSLYWYEEDKDRNVNEQTLNCATAKKDETIINKMIELSISIDKQYG